MSSTPDPRVAVTLASFCLPASTAPALQRSTLVCSVGWYCTATIHNGGQACNASQHDPSKPNYSDRTGHAIEIAHLTKALIYLHKIGPWRDAYALMQKLQIPGHRNFQTLNNGIGRGIAKHPLRLGDIRLRMAHVSRTEIPVDRLTVIRHALLRKPAG